MNKLNSWLILTIGYVAAYTFVETMTGGFMAGVATLTVIEMNQGDKDEKKKSNQGPS